jgi:hypothetical protein
MELDIVETQWPGAKTSAVDSNNDLSRINGRGERIRTSDLLVPNQALYQAEPRPDSCGNAFQWPRYSCADSRTPLNT